MKKKKLLAFMLACATAAGMISGCGSQSTTAETETASESKSTETTADTAAATTEATGDVVNINWYLFDGAGQADQQAVQDAMNAYTADKIGVTVTL